ncbi:MAG: GAF and ANTAR domain-containing protein, partial [Actinomycetes bacterium]
MDLAEEFAQMALRLHDEATPEDTVERVVDHALKAVSCAYAGVTLVHGRRRVETAAATHPLVAEIDRIQMECGEGPAKDAREEQHSVLVEDTRLEPRWPVWAARVAETGVRSVLSVRMYTSAATLGTLNLYDDQPGRFDADDQAVASALARHAAVALASVRQHANLWQAIDARKLVGQAQGILMERFGLTDDQAFA